ncbi:MAG: hypothetical protein K2Q26_08180 [Bdellovibrionales bacterium]|nr:hypothetical protein [Bdellovibrionales bacterium]
MEKNIYSNQSEFDFSVTTHLPGHFAKPEVTLAVYESGDCSGEYDEQSQVGFERVRASSLQDGKVYSFRVLISVDKKNYRSPCTPWVGIDQQAPNPVTPVMPPSDGFTTELRMTARWNPTVDNGISGLNDKPYRIKLFDQNACTGTILRVIDTDSLLEEFADLSHGNFYSYQVLALDRANNESPVSCSPSTEIDIYAPGFTMSDPGSDSGFTNSTTVDVTFVNDSWAGYWCMTTDAAFVPTSPTDACPGGQGSTNGWHTSRPTSYNLVGADGLKTIYAHLLNQDGDPRTNKIPLVAIELDRVAPAAFAITGITGGTDTVLDAYLNDNDDPLIHFTASADLKNYTVSILNADTSLNCQTIVNAAVINATLENCTLTNGTTYTARVRAADYAGNSTVAADFPFVVDLTPPGPFTILGVRSNNDGNVDTWASGSPDVVWTSSVDAVDYQSSVRNAGSQLGVCPQHTIPSVSLNYDFNSLVCSPWVDGENYEVLLRSRDDASLYTTATNQPFAFRADLTAPALTIDVQPLNLNNSTTATYVFTNSDNLSGVQTVECRWNGGAYSSCVSPYNQMGLPQGNYTFDVRAIDNVGNSITQSHAFALDITPPTVTITSGPAPYVNSATANFTFTSVDSGAAGVLDIECRLDGGIWMVCTSPHTELLLPEGPHLFEVRSQDSLNQMSAVVSHSWSVDVTSPALSFTSVPADLIGVNSSSHSFTVSDALSGIASVQCRIDGGAYGACTSPRANGSLAHGNHTVDVRAVDNVGNIALITDTFEVDLNPPTVTITSGPPVYTNLPAAAFTFTAVDSGSSGVAMIECSLDGGPFNACTSPHPVVVGSLGAHNLRIRASDNFGHMSGIVQHNWSYDTTPPSVSITSHPGASSTSTSATFTFNASDAESSIVSRECRWNGGAWMSCVSGVSQSGLPVTTNTFDVRVTNGIGLTATASHTWLIFYSYSWQTSGWGSCSASPSWSYGSWSSCVNTSCSGGSQSRSATCVNTSGSESRSVWCQRSDGATVADGFCGGGQPSSTQACSASCGGSPTTTQACVGGTPCRYNLSHITMLFTGFLSNSCRPHGFEFLPGCTASAGNPYGQTCETTGNQCYYFWAAGPVWQASNPTLCSVGQAYLVRNEYTCQFCPSGNWGSGTYSTSEPHVAGSYTNLGCQP